MMPVTESLAARAATLLNRLAQVEAQAADQQVRTEIETARKRASTSRAALGDALRVIPVLETLGAVPPSVPERIRPDVAKARTALRSAASSVTGAPVSEIASRIHARSVNDALQTADDLARSLLADLNKSVDRKRLAILPSGIDQAIVVYPGASHALAVGLQLIQSRLRKRVSDLSADELEQRLQGLISDAAQWAEKRPQLESSLVGQHPEVQAFLRAAATEAGAPWSLITLVVQAWLADPENTADLKVVLRT